MESKRHLAVQVSDLNLDQWVRRTETKAVQVEYRLTKLEEEEEEVSIASAKGRFGPKPLHPKKTNSNTQQR